MQRVHQVFVIYPMRCNNIFINTCTTDSVDQINNSFMKKFIFGVSFILNFLSVIVAQTGVETIVFSDDFNGTNMSGGSPATHYTFLKQTISGSEAENSLYSSGELRIPSPAGSVGRNGVFGDLSAFSSPYSKTLNQIDADSVSWTFNIRANRETSSGFDDGKFGIAAVLVADKADYNTSNGYAVVSTGKTSSDRSFRLVKFTNGLNEDTKFVNIINVFPGGANLYPSVRVTYIKNTNTWKFYGRSDGGSFNNPGVGTFAFYGSAQDDTYVNAEMNCFGFFMNYKSYSVGTNMIVDNFTVKTYQSVDKRIIPIDDTYVYASAGLNTMRGMEKIFATGHSDVTENERISYLKFDITYLSPFIDSLRLRLYTNGILSGGDKDHIFDLYPVQNNTWSEDEVTYENKDERFGNQINTPVLASYVVPAGERLYAQHIEFTGDNLVKYIVDSLTAGKKYVSFRLKERNSVKRGSSDVVVEFHSKENESGYVPEILVTEKNMDPLTASAILVNGISLADFSATTYRYVYKLPFNATSVPVVNATTKYNDVTLELIQATGINGNEESRTAKIIIRKGTEALTYSIVFELLPPPDDARLSAIFIDGKPLEFFEMEKTDYLVYLPYTTVNVPVVEVIPNEPSASTVIVAAISIDPLQDQSKRTAILNITSGDGTKTKTYKVLFHKLPELDIVLAIGQSNMAGRAPFDAYKAPMENVYLLTPAGGMEIASNPLNKYSNIRKDISIQKLGPSYSCALKVQKHTGKPIAFVVNAQGGSALSTWYQPGKANYDGTIKRAKEAQAFGKFRGIIWLQGEGDSSYPATYLTRLKEMVTSLRSDLKEPDLFFVASEIAYWRGGGTGSTIFNDSIRTISGRIPNSDWISAEGCTPLIDETDPHFDAPSAILLGERFADKLIKQVFTTSSTGKLNHADGPVVLPKPQGMSIVNKEKSLSYYLTDLLGHVKHSGTLEAFQSVHIQAEKGIYLLSFVQQDQNVTHKIFVR